MLTGCAYGDAQDFSDPVEKTIANPSFTKKSISLSTGITMKYVEAGNPNGNQVILLHGYTDTSRSFFPTIQALLDSRTNLHIFALDLRGHGGSSMPSTTACRNAPEVCFEPSDFAADVISFMNKKNIGDANIVGHSLGSLVAQELAMSSPSRVDSIMLIGTAVRGANNPVFNDFLEPLMEDAWRAHLEATRPGFVWPRDAYLLTTTDADPDATNFMATNWVADPTAEPAFLNAILPETVNTKIGTWLGGNRNLISFDHRTRLTQLTVPALVIWATQDSLFLDSPDQIEVRAALDAAVNACRTSYYFKNYGVQPLPASGFQENEIGHNVQWGAAEAIAADITRWVRDGEPTRDRPRADQNNLLNLLIDPGAATIIERHPAPSCN